MADFPEFMRSPANRIATSSQFTEAIDGYVFDGADGSQVAFWTCREDRVSKEHTHPFDEYVVVIEGQCTALLDEKDPVVLNAGDELFVPRGTRQRMAVRAGTRTMHVFGGKRANREGA
jgi:quercetin dioxygenase-like cupin family protein